MGCYNEAENVEQACREVRQIFAQLPWYDYEHIFIDNASEDGTVEILKEQVKAIVGQAQRLSGLFLLGDVLYDGDKV